MTKEERIANIVADLEGWEIKSDDSGSYLEVECGEFLLEMDLCDIPSIETLTKEELAEREVLRKEYLENFRAHFRSRLQNVRVVHTQEEYDELVKKNNN